MITGATLFTGGGGVDIGMKMAGIDVRWGIEYDEQVASIATQNGFPVTVADITQCDPHNFERVDILHASPPCPSFSAAKTNGHETENDIALAKSVCAFIEVLQPAVFTLENVQAYDKSESYRLIVETLNRLGYGFNHWILNAADYGVPQTRVRMVVIALRNGKQPTRPPVTHVNPKTIVQEQLALFDTQLPSWIGWYEAIEDLIPTLPESKFADWQLRRLPEELKTLLANTQINAERGKHYREMEEPSETINVTHAPKGVIVDSVLVENKNSVREATIRHQQEQAFTVVTDSAESHAPKGIIIDGKNSRSSDTERVNHITAREDFNPVWTVQSESHPNHFRAFLANPAWPTRDEDDPCFTITAGSFKDSRECSWKPRAFVLNGITDNFVGDVTPDEQEKPARTVTASMYRHQPRAFIVDGDSSTSVVCKNDNEPTFTQRVDRTDDLNARALFSKWGRVVQMTPRALARFQSFPDWYELPDKKMLACKVIGNAVPPLLYFNVVKHAIKQGELV